MVLLKKLLMNRKWLSLAMIMFNLISVGIGLWWNMHLSNIIDSVSAGAGVSFPVLIGAVGIIIVNAAAAYGQVLLSGWMGETLTHDLRMGFARNIVSMPLAELENRNAGEVLSGIQNEMVGITDYLGRGLLQGVDNVVRFIATLLWLFILNPVLTLSANLPVILITVYVFFSSKVIGKATEKSLEAQKQMNGFADTLITLFPIIRLFDASKLIAEKYLGKLRVWESLTVRRECRKALLMSLSGIMAGIPLLILLFVGGIMTVRGTISLGILYIFINLSGDVSGVMMNMPGMVAGFRQFAANMKRLETCIQIKGRN